jgi:RecA-family ATPase
MSKDLNEQLNQGTFEQDPRKIHFERMTVASKDQSTAAQGNAPDESEPEARSALEERWITLTPEDIAQPPKRKWLLTIGSKGAMPLGKAVVLAAGGGTGKTLALCQLALSVASGKDWFGFTVCQPGNVLLLLGEEDLDETKRRISAAAADLKLSHEERTDTLKRLVVCPLAGLPVAFVQDDGRRNVVRTSLLKELENRLSAKEQWSLVAVDPLSRFAGCDAEKDNAAATRFVQAVESLVKAPGNPTVIVSAHSSAQSLHDKSPGVRGVTGLVDGFRQVITLCKIGSGESRGVLLRLTKSNYTLPWDDVILSWNNENYEGSALRVATDDERDAMENAEKAAKAAKGKSKTPDETSDVIDAAIVSVLSVAPRKNKNDIVAAVGKGKKAVLDRIKVLEREDGPVVYVDGFYRLREKTP